MPRIEMEQATYRYRAIYFIDATAKGYGQWHRSSGAVRFSGARAADPLGVPLTVCGLPSRGSLSFTHCYGAFCAGCWPETLLRDYFRQCGGATPRVLTNEEIEERVLNTIALKTAVVPTQVGHDYGTGRSLADAIKELEPPTFTEQAIKAVVILRKSQAWLVDELTRAWVRCGPPEVTELHARTAITKLIEPSKVAAENVLNKAREWKLIE